MSESALLFLVSEWLILRVEITPVEHLASWQYLQCIQPK
jgi:hypothetical protein